MGQVKPFRLDDDTIIYVQSDDDIDTTEITQALEPPTSSELEDDLDPCGSPEVQVKTPNSALAWIPPPKSLTLRQTMTKN